MNREDVLVLLGSGVEQKWITVEQAVRILRRYDAGEIEPDALPLPHRSAVAEVTEADLERAMRAIEEGLERDA